MYFLVEVLVFGGVFGFVRWRFGAVVVCLNVDGFCVAVFVVGLINSRRFQCCEFNFVRDR